jgi:hypothetical protein
MDTVLSIMGGLVLVYCLVYFNDQSVLDPAGRMIDMDEGSTVTDGEVDLVLGLPSVEGAAGTADG